MDRLPLNPYPYSRAAALAAAAKKGDTLYPRLFILGGVWVRQDYAGAAITVVPQAGAEHLLLTDEGTAA